MTDIDIKGMHFKAVNEALRASRDSSITLKNCMGQRYIGAGSSGKTVRIEGIPGNALGAYMDGTQIEVMNNAQDATGDTMNDGQIIIHGSAGDATGYAMRGGKIFIKDNVGYRAGIHMKAYKEKYPVIVVGGRAGSFLGEYLAGGMIVVLGLDTQHEAPVGYFCGTGMHGGAIYLRTDTLPHDLPAQVEAHEATAEEMAAIAPHIEEYCRLFGVERKTLSSKKFYCLKANTKNPYKQMYTPN